MVSNKLNNKIAALSGVALKAPRSRRAGHQKMIVSLVTVLSIVEVRWWLLHGKSWRSLTQDNIAESGLLNPQSLY